MKNLIINADDFGMSEEVNEGVKIGIKEGIVTSVSLMVNMPFFEDAVKFLKNYHNISIGLHFNITEGKPIMLPANAGSLLREDDSFYNWPLGLMRLILKKTNLKEIEEELAMQYNILKSTGLPISHIDSHHHVHLYPSIFDIVGKFVNKQKNCGLRGRRFNIWNLILGVWRKPNYTQILVNLFLLLNNLKYKNYRHLYHINRFYDLNWGKDMSTKQFLEILSKLPEDTTEFVCHLAVLSKSGNREFLLPRYKTLKLLTYQSTKKYLTQNGITLIKRE